MEKIKDIKEVHKIVLDLAKAFHKICVKHNIPYYLHYGGLIGAVRHHGFIPWDDDLDFVVPRKYIKSLLTTLKEELPEYYSVKDIDSNIGIWGEIIKIEDDRTVIKEFGNDNPHSIFIDIFILDYTRKDWRDKLIRKMMAVYAIVFNKTNPIIYYGYKCIGMIFGKHWLIHSIKYIVSKSGQYYTVFSGGEIQTMPVSVFGTPTLHKFEDTELYCIENYDYALRQIFGDYMKLPPENERHHHIQEMYYK